MPSALKELANEYKRQDDKIRQKKDLQLTIGQLIQKLEGHETYESSANDGEERPKKVRLDMGYNYPSDVGSYRGYYQDLAIRYSDDHEDRMTAQEFKETLEDAIGTEFTGYKGGEFEMTEDTPVWVAKWGNASRTAVSGVRMTATRIILETRIVNGEGLEGEEL